MTNPSTWLQDLQLDSPSSDNLKAALNLYLNDEHGDRDRPRVAFDDSDKILTCKVRGGDPDGQQPILSLISEQPLVRPLALALAADGTLFIADAGSDSAWMGPRVRHGLYQLPPQAAHAPAVTTPVAVPTGNWFTDDPAVVALDDDEPESLHVVLASGALHRLARPGFTHAALGQLPLVYPLSVVYDPSVPGGALIVLDSGDGQRLPAQLILCTGVKVTSAVPFKIWPARPLRRPLDPTSLLLLPDGTLLVGDCGKKGERSPADFWVIDRSGGIDPATWTEVARPLLDNNVRDNPLVAPVAMVAEDARHFLVVDGGLKSYYFPDPANPFVRDNAQSAAIYRVELEHSRGGGISGESVTRISDQGGLVYPSAMVLAHDRVLVSDPGLTVRSAFRVNPYEFGVIVHFTNGTTEFDDRVEFLSALERIVQQHKPAHTIATLVSQA